MRCPLIGLPCHPPLQALKTEACYAAKLREARMVGLDSNIRARRLQVPTFEIKRYKEKLGGLLL